MFEILADKRTSALTSPGIFASGKTLFSGLDFALTLNKFGRELFEKIAGADGVKKLSENSCLIEKTIFRGKTVLVGIYHDNSEYPSEFVIPEKYEFELE
jgi:hypothetical protein